MHVLAIDGRIVQGALKMVWVALFKELVLLGGVVGQFRTVDLREAVEEVVRLLLLPKHYSISRSREEYLLAQHPCRVWQQSDHRQNQQYNPSFARSEDLEVLSIDFWLENLSNWCRVATNHARIVEC